MSKLLKKIEHDVLNLTSQERAFLADRLLSSLGEEALTEVDEAWIEEADRRYKDYKDGKRPGIPAHEVFAKADSMLK